MPIDQSKGVSSSQLVLQKNNIKGAGPDTRYKRVCEVIIETGMIMQMTAC